MPYTHIFSSFVNHIQDYISQGGYYLLFIFTIIEGIPLVGMFIPGHITIITGGFLAKIGTLDLGWVMAISIVGAILGDCIGFYLGRSYGLPLIDKLRPYFFVTDTHIEKAQALLARHTGKAMIIGRFTPATRSFMPFLVGASQTSVGRFWFFNILGAVSWVVSSVLLGYIFGAAYHVVAGFIGKILVIAILVAILIVWGYRFVNSRFHIFKRYELFTLILNVLSLWALAATVDKIADQSFRLNFDVWVSIFMEKLGNLYPFVVTLADGISAVGGTVVTAGLGIILGIYFLLKKKWRSAGVILLSIASTGIVTILMKEFFMSSRPLNAVHVIVNDPSFPSGHASLAAAFFIALAYLLAPKIHHWVKREIIIVICVLLAIAIGLSRLVLNVHWLSDVVAGWSLGVFLATASILFVRYASALIVKKDYKKQNSKMYKLVLIRHGESLWNKENRFAGWVDVDLSEKGIEEAHLAGKTLKEAGFSFDLAFTSRLKRANRTLDIILVEMKEDGIEVFKTWKLNERHYGSLQGLNKSEMAVKYGEDQVKLWRRGYDVAIPPLTKDSDMYPGNDPLYKDLTESEIPLSENLKKVVERVVPYWLTTIVPELKAGHKIIITASGNSLRALIKHIEGISDEDIVNVDIPTGIPLVCELDNDFRLVSKKYLADEKRLSDAIQAVANQGKVK